MLAISIKEVTLGQEMLKASKLRIDSAVLVNISDCGEEMTIKGKGRGLYPTLDRADISKVLESTNLYCSYFSAVDDDDCKDRFTCKLKIK